MYKNGLQHCKAFIVYPEKFYNYSNEEKIHTDIPVLVASNEQIKGI